MLVPFETIWQWQPIHYHSHNATIINITSTNIRHHRNVCFSNLRISYFAQHNTASLMQTCHLYIIQWHLQKKICTCTEETRNCHEGGMPIIESDAPRCQITGRFIGWIPCDVQELAVSGVGFLTVSNDWQFYIAYTRGSSIWQFDSLNSQPRRHGERTQWDDITWETHNVCVSTCTHTHTMLLSSQM